MVIVGVTGRQRAGKSLVCNLLKENGFKVVSVDKNNLKESKRGDLDKEKGNMEKKLGQIWRENRDNAINKLLSQKLDSNKDFAIDSVKRKKEVELLRKKLKHFFLVSITASPETRLKRILDTSKEEKSIVKESFIKKERLENFLGIKKTMDKADLQIENERSFEKLKEQVDLIPALSVKVKVSTPIKPTEKMEKVLKSVKNIFPDLKIDENSFIQGKGFGTHLKPFRKKIFNQRIIDTTREKFEKGRKNSYTKILLSKQAAFVGKVNLHVDSSLGPIKLEVQGKINEFLKWIAPQTIKGEPVE